MVKGNAVQLKTASIVIRFHPDTTDRIDGRRRTR